MARSPSAARSRIMVVACLGTIARTQQRPRWFASCAADYASAPSLLLVLAPVRRPVNPCRCCKRTRKLELWSIGRGMFIASFFLTLLFRYQERSLLLFIYSLCWPLWIMVDFKRIQIVWDCSVCYRIDEGSNLKSSNWIFEVRNTVLKLYLDNLMSRFDGF